MVAPGRTPPTTTPTPIAKWLWLRELNWANKTETGAWADVEMTSMGVAAARETLVTASSQLAGMWTGLFESMLANNTELRWQGKGPGTGRDARIAYSSMFGRYLARAFLTEFHGIVILVPLDLARTPLRDAGYRIVKRPQGRGLQADWIGLAVGGRLVVAEAKGTFDKGVAPWRGPGRRPKLVDTAMEQARRTHLIRWPLGAKLPMERWGVVSRWATEENGRTPTIIAAYERAPSLSIDDWSTLTDVLLQCDVQAALRELGHTEVAATLRSEGVVDRRASVGLSIGDQETERGFAAAAGPFGILPIRDQSDIEQVRGAVAGRWPLAVLSLAEQYVRRVVGDAPGSIRQLQDSTTSAGLTVVWPSSRSQIILRD